MQWESITSRVSGDLVVIDLKGRVCLCSEDPLPAFVGALLDQGFLKFLVNLDEVPHIDSMGLGGIVRAYTTVMRKGGRLALVHVRPRMRHLLHTTKLDAVFEIFDAEDAAVLGFGGSLPAAG